MNKFLTKLQVEQVEDTNESGRGSWRVISPLVYNSDKFGVITVPVGFVTDFASVPRIPMVFDWLGDRGNLAATIHDWLYTNPHPVSSREDADEILQEALIAQGVGETEAEAMFIGVRTFGELYWD